MLAKYVTECVHIAPKDTYTNVQRTLFIISKKLETAQISVIINKLLQIHTMEYHLAMKRMNKGYDTIKWINL